MTIPIRFGDAMVLQANGLAASGRWWILDVGASVRYEWMRDPIEPAGHRIPVRRPPPRRVRRRPVRRGPARRGPARRGWWVAGAVVVLLGAVLIVIGATGGSPGLRRAAARIAASGGPRHHHAPPTAPVPTTASTVPPTTTTTTSPGTLPQTTTLPSSTSPQFHAEMADLWQGVVSGSTAPAMPAFFPLGAYLQLKTIPDPRQDWQDRLVGGFSVDLAAAHALLGSAASNAQLVGVTVPTQYAHWVTPGVCYNSIGYYEVPNARVVYRVGAAERSFGIASMISWRGQWYVVHLGAVVRTTPPQGMVDAPATGPGTSAYSSTC